MHISVKMSGIEINVSEKQEFSESQEIRTVFIEDMGIQ